MKEFSTNVLWDKNRVFAYVGGPQKKDMIRHRAQSAWVHPDYKPQEVQMTFYGII